MGTKTAHYVRYWITIFFNISYLTSESLKKCLGRDRNIHVQVYGCVHSYIRVFFGPCPLSCNTCMDMGMDMDMDTDIDSDILYDHELDYMVEVGRRQCLAPSSLESH